MHLLTVTGLFFLDEMSTMNGQLYNMRVGDQQVSGQSPQKPVNLLPEIPAPTSRKLNDREQRDCEVIGKHFETRIGLNNGQIH